MKKTFKITMNTSELLKKYEATRGKRTKFHLTQHKRTVVEQKIDQLMHEIEEVRMLCCVHYRLLRRGLFVEEANEDNQTDDVNVETAQAIYPVGNKNEGS